MGDVRRKAGFASTGSGWARCRRSRCRRRSGCWRCSRSRAGRRWWFVGRCCGWFVSSGWWVWWLGAISAWCMDVQRALRLLLVAPELSGRVGDGFGVDDIVLLGGGEGDEGEGESGEGGGMHDGRVSGWSFNVRSSNFDGSMCIASLFRIVICCRQDAWSDKCSWSMGEERWSGRSGEVSALTSMNPGPRSVCRVR